MKQVLVACKLDSCLSCRYHPQVHPKVLNASELPGLRVASFTTTSTTESVISPFIDDKRANVNSHKEKKESKKEGKQEERSGPWKEGKKGSQNDSAQWPLRIQKRLVFPVAE
jgi:hypothetical protein